MRLEPLTRAHAEALNAAAADGELWNTQVTIIPKPEAMNDYIQFALDGLAQGNQLPFVIVRKSGTGILPVSHAGGVTREVHTQDARDTSKIVSPTRAGAVARPSGRAQHDQIVGSTRFYEIRPQDRAAAIGYTWLSKSAQRTSVNTECKLLLLTHAFENWRCNRVELITDVLNEQSRAAILRLGAKQEGILRKHLILPNGRVRDSVIFSIIDSEWERVKQKLQERLEQSSSP